MATIEVLSDGCQIFAVSDGQAYILDGGSGQPVWELPVTNGNTIAHTLDGSLFASWRYGERTVRTQTALSSEAPRELDSDVEDLELLDLAFSTNGSRLVAAARDHEKRLVVSVWDTTYIGAIVKGSEGVTKYFSNIFL